MFKLNNGYFDNGSKCWIWNLKQLDQIKFIPYILNPQFLLVNILQLNQIIYSIYIKSTSVHSM